MPPNPPIRPQLHVQNTPNPNNKLVQQAKTANVPTYCIFLVQCNDMHLRSGRIVQTENEPTIIEEEENNELEEASKKTVNPNPIVTINKDSENEKTPPYPEHLAIAKTEPQPEFDLIGELKNLYVKIPLLKAIRDVPIYTKPIKDVCVKKPGRKLCMSWEGYQNYFKERPLL